MVQRLRQARKRAGLSRTGGSSHQKQASELEGSDCSEGAGRIINPGTLEERCTSGRQAAGMATLRGTGRLVASAVPASQPYAVTGCNASED